MAALAAIPTDTSQPYAPAAVAGTGGGPKTISYGGLRAVPLQTIEEERTRSQELQEQQAQPIVTGVAGHIQSMFQLAWIAKRNLIDPRLWASIRARRGEYSAQKLQEIRAVGGSEVWAGLTSAKCRAAGGWIRDVMMGTGSERPWEINPMPIPDLPPQINEMLLQEAMQPIMAQVKAGNTPSQTQVTQMMSMLRDQALSAVRDEARKRADRMADKMETQLLEGGFQEALDEFIDDLTTYPTAFMKGPVIRMKPTLSWGADGQVQVQVKLVKTWERVSPFNVYPAPGACDVQDGYLIEKHRLSKTDLNQLIGVDGYNADAIRAVIQQYDHGLTSWLNDLAMQYQAEGKDTFNAWQNPDGLIDALQFWGCVSGQMLRDWGMSEKDVPEPTQDYYVEAWLIGQYVIKAVLNYDPLGRRPYYATSYEKIPGNVWGNSVADLVSDCQDIVNATARAIVNNMALASGPQVTVLVDRLAAGEDVTQLQPWRIWQMKADPLSGQSQPPVEFFQPNSNVQELMQVFNMFSELGDEYSGIPRYLTGDTTGGAGRTASGLSMLINNAGKSIKQVINNIDSGLMKPLLERLYYHNMRYEDDPELKGDVAIEARGADALVAREAAQQRRNEFLAATNNPVDMQIVGPMGRAAVLREIAKDLDMNPDRVVPTPEVLEQKFAAQQALAGATPQGGAPGGGSAQPGAPPPGGPPAQAGPPQLNGQQLMDNTPVADHFSPPARGLR